MNKITDIFSIQEKWKDIPNIALYEISNYGVVKSLKFGKEKILKPWKRNGYLQICLSQNNKTKKYKIHRLVLEAFVGPCPSGMEGCHNDGNKDNNFIGNLRWDTRSENIKDAIKHKTFVDNRGFKSGNSVLNKEKIKKIFTLWSKGLTHKKIAKIFEVSTRTIYSIRSGKQWGNIK